MKRAAISSSENARTNKNERSEDVGVLSPRVCSVLCCCQESDGGGARLTMAAKTTAMARGRGEGCRGRGWRWRRQERRSRKAEARGNRGRESQKDDCCTVGLQIVAQKSTQVKEEKWGPLLPCLRRGQTRGIYMRIKEEIQDKYFYAKKV